MLEINRFHDAFPLNRFTDLLHEGKRRHNGGITEKPGSRAKSFIAECVIFSFLLHLNLPLNHSQALISTG